MRGGSAGDFSIKGRRPEEGSLYDLIKGRMDAVREFGKVNTSRNLPLWAAEDEDGPRLPRASEMFRRKILARLGFEYTKRRDRIVCARRRPYVARWRKAYCWEKSQRVLVEKDFRQRVFLGATFINKNPTGEYTWSPTADT